jgi:hypothetical protein
VVLGIILGACFSHQSSIFEEFILLLVLECILFNYRMERLANH